jgi:hypothetical protein
MATSRTFDAMLNEYLPNELLIQELKKRDWLLQNVEMDNSWLGGELIVPFNSAVGSSVTFGSLADSTDIAEEINVRGSLTSYKEAWGSMLFKHTDIMQHGKVSEQNLLRILPDAVNRHMDYFKSVVSQNLLTGAHVASLTADGDASGNITVAQPDRFQLGQKVSVDDDDSNAASGYIRAINMNTGVITIYDARTAGAVVNLSAYTVAQGAKVYNDGQQSNGFTSLKSQLLSLANGGDTNIFGVVKTASPYTQAINVDGAAISASNILSKIFDAYVTVRRLGKGKPFKVVMSYKNFGNCVKNIESSKGAFNVNVGSKKAAQYGWDEIEVGGFAGTLSLVAVQEMDDDCIMLLDMEAIKFYSNGGFKKRQSPDGREYFELRATTGYSYIVDTCLFGDLILQRPSACGIIHSISYT